LTEEQLQNGSNPVVKRPITHYNKPSRRQALLEIRRLIVEEGLSHNEIQLRLNIPPTSYFRYLDMLFETEQKAIAGNHYTYQRLLNETLILQQRYLRRARRLEKLASDPEVDGETRRQAECNAAELERAVHDVSYLAPSYLAAQKLLPRPKDKSDTKLSMTAKNTNKEEKDPSKVERIKLAGEFRRQNIIQQQQQQQ
jgi:hypothetical protein